MNCKNQYLKIVLSIAGLSAVPIAIFTLTSCDGSNVKSLVEAQPTPAPPQPVCIGSICPKHAGKKNFPLRI